MKGPGRHRYATRRTWECPACHRKEMTGGDVTSLQCQCQARVNPPVVNWMKLLEEPRRRPKPPSQETEPVAVFEPSPPGPDTPPPTSE